MLGAMDAAKDATLRLHAVADNAAATMIARRRQGMNGAFKAIEGVRLAVHHHLKTLVILIAANVAYSHRFSPLLPP